MKVPGVNKHLKNIFDSGDLQRDATVSKMKMVRAEGGREVSREVEHPRARKFLDPNEVWMQDLANGMPAHYCAT